MLDRTMRARCQSLVLPLPHSYIGCNHWGDWAKAIYGQPLGIVFAISCESKIT